MALLSLQQVAGADATGQFGRPACDPPVEDLLVDLRVKLHRQQPRSGAVGLRVVGRTREELDAVGRDFVVTQQTTRLSQAALETLAVIAYRQPISRGSIAAIRAVNVDSVVRTLVSRGLITEAFTDPETGAIHYETTDLLLAQLGINSIDDLPKVSPLLDDGRDGFGDLS